MGRGSEAVARASLFSQPAHRGCEQDASVPWSLRASPPNQGGPFGGSGSLRGRARESSGAGFARLPLVPPRRLRVALQGWSPRVLIEVRPPSVVSQSTQPLKTRALHTKKMDLGGFGPPPVLEDG